MSTTSSLDNVLIGFLIVYMNLYVLYNGCLCTLGVAIVNIVVLKFSTIIPICCISLNQFLGQTIILKFTPIGNFTLFLGPQEVVLGKLTFISF